MTKIKADFGGIASKLAAKQTFKEFYRWLFIFLRETEERKTIDAEPALEMSRWCDCSL
jgi:hypothetical protein